MTSAAELSILLFVLYAGIAALPLAHALEPLLPPERRSLAFAAPAVRSLRARPVRATAPAPSVRAVGVPIVIAAIILVPGLTVTVTALPPYLGDLYGSFGNVTEADFALLSWAADHLPSAPRVLVAPGSAAQFLPGYRPDAALVYPVGPLDRNDSYRTVVAELDRGQLDPAGLAAMGALGVGYVAVTQNISALWAPFDPAPLLAAPAEFPVLFHEADAYLFAVQLGPPAG